MYRAIFLCSLDRLAKGLIDNPVFSMAGITALEFSETEVVENLVQEAVLNEYVQRGIGREIILTAKGLQLCDRLYERKLFNLLSKYIQMNASPNFVNCVLAFI